MMIHHYNGGHRLVVVIFFKSSGKWAPRSCSCGPWCRSTIVPGWASCSYPPGSRRPQSKICIIIGILLAVSENMYTYIYIYTCYVHHYLMMMMMMIIIIITVIIPNDDIDVFQQGPEHSRAFCHLSPQKGRSQMEVGGPWEGLLAK